MRRILVGIAVLVVALSPTTSVPANGQAQVAAVLGVAQSILSIATSVKSLFGNNNNDEAFQHEVINRLARIDQQLGTIQAKLDEINARFDQLQIHIDKQFEHQRVVDVITVIRSIDQHYPEWVKPGYSPDASGAIPTPSSVLNDLRRTVTAVCVYPSYANFSTVALGMVYEHLILVNALHETDDNEDSQRGFKQYAVFFKDAASISPERSGTIGQSWLAADAAMKQVDAAFAGLPKPLYCADIAASRPIRMTGIGIGMWFKRFLTPETQ
jgi:hypothetical protein